MWQTQDARACFVSIRARVLVGILLCIDSVPGPAQEGLATEQWKFDELHLTNGTIFTGLIVDETPAVVRFKIVIRPPGESTRTLLQRFERKQIQRIVRLDQEDRKTLAQRLRTLQPGYEQEQMDLLKLTRVPWGHGSKEFGLSYTSDYFVLVSNAGELIIKRAALRLEQVYAAYARCILPRQQTSQPTRIRLIRSLGEYHKALAERGQRILNPAFYDRDRNEIVCASELERLHVDLEKTRKENKEVSDRLKQDEKRVHKLPKGKEREDQLAKLAADRQRLEQTNRQNDRVFEKATERLFQTLYHEAFHAYLANYVYPPGQTDIPRWLNEGLAQIFETAVLEAGELRVGHADGKRLADVKNALRERKLVALKDLLQSGPMEFLVAHVGDQRVSDRYYLASWALAFYLTFELKKLGMPELNCYVCALKQQQKDPLKAFEQLVGQPLDEFELTFHEYLRQLRSNGESGG